LTVTWRLANSSRTVAKREPLIEAKPIGNRTPFNLGKLFTTPGWVAISAQKNLMGRVQAPERAAAKLATTCSSAEQAAAKFAACFRGAPHAVTTLSRVFVVHKTWEQGLLQLVRKRRSVKQSLLHTFAAPHMP
jgi:hypothetical protein